MPRLTGRFTAACIGFALLIAPATSGAAETAAAQVADLKYDVYVGGLHIYSLDVEMRLQSGRYHLTARGGTQGMVGMVYTWDTDLAADGLDQDGRVEAQRYVSKTQWQKPARTVALGFGADGPLHVAAGSAAGAGSRHRGQPADVAAQGRRRSAELRDRRGPRLAKTGRCDQTVPVFDGSAGSM
jgi:hypothetical protein